MKKLIEYYIVVLIVSAAFATVSESFAGNRKELNILFIGNSFTFRHDLDQLVKKVFEEGHPECDVQVKRVVYGGQNMYKHSTYYFSQSFLEQSTIADEEIISRIRKMEAFLRQESAPDGWEHFQMTVRPDRKLEAFSDIHKNIKKAIRDHEQLLKNNPRVHWDYVVLQSWQDVHPSLDEGYAKYVREIADVAKEQGTEVILYITAPNIQNSKPVAGPQLQDRVELEVKLAKALEKEIQAHCVVPVPLGINMIQRDGTDLTFCYENDFHPNQTSAFLTANMFYSAFFKESTEGFEFNSVTETNSKGQGEGKDPDGNDATVIFDDGTKFYLQKMAYEAVTKFDMMPRPEQQVTSMSHPR